MVTRYSFALQQWSGNSAATFQMDWIDDGKANEIGQWLFDNVPDVSFVEVTKTVETVTSETVFFEQNSPS